jgi:hypothetical protein
LRRRSCESPKWGAAAEGAIGAMGVAADTAGTAQGGRSGRRDGHGHREKWKRKDGREGKGHRTRLVSWYHDSRMPTGLDCLMMEVTRGLHINSQDTGLAQRARPA